MKDRTSFGESEFSIELYILAAQVPDKPLPPTTTVE